MFADEVRDPNALEELRVSRVAADPEAFYRELNALKGKGYDRKIAHLLEERKDLKRRIASAHEALNEERRGNERLAKDNEQLRTKLVQLRGSKTMRLGKAIATPVKVANKAVSDPAAFVSQTARDAKTLGLNLSKAVAAKANRSKSGTLQAPKAEASVKKPEPKTTSSTPAPDPVGGVSVEAELNRLWYTDGNLLTAAQFVDEHTEAFNDASEKSKILAQRVAGAARLEVGGVELPRRTRECVYVAEPGRVMYCVNQSPVFNSNGYSTRTRGVVEGLVEAGLDPVVVARSGYPWDSKVDNSKPQSRRYVRNLGGVTYVHTPGGNLNRDPLDVYFQVAADAFVREARLNRPSIIQSASNFRTALPALIAARRVGVPFVYEVRGLWEITEASAKPGFEKTERFNFMRDMETLVALEADHVLAITPQVADELVNRGVPRERISIAPNAVDTNRFLPIPEDRHYRAAKKIPADGPVIGFAGSLVQYEGLDLLIQASEKLGREGIEHQVVITGSGAAERDLRDLAKRSPNSNVSFLGRLPQAEIPRLMSTFDIVACPRRSQLVTELVSPLKPLESFSAGIATILSDVAPNADLAGSLEAPRAALFKAGDVEDLTEKLRNLILDSEFRAELGRRARLWTVRDRSWTSVGREIAGSLSEARQTHSASGQPGRRTSELKVAVIGDEFTRTTLRDSFDVTLLERKGWSEQLTQQGFDLVFVESAWEGNGGEWHRGVGHYSDEESSDLRGLLRRAEELGIPTVFWNKEDPVHFSRFAPNAALFNHVFTTDANMIPRYASIEGNRIRTVSSLPFYAQPKIHNPLPGSKEFNRTIAYAGTYYGERYADRSKGLDLLLRVAQKRGLTVYDRQADNPESPYKFPAKYEQNVQGALPYEEVIDSYSAHIAHLNVSSVTNSPTMFSRRVVEIPACGGIVLSSPGRGITETLGSNIPTSAVPEDVDAWMLEWSKNPIGRLDEIWRQMRTVYRSHTTVTAMAIVCRTAGIPTQGLGLPSYALSVESDDEAVLDSVLQQSILPVEVSGAFSDIQKKKIRALGVNIVRKDQIAAEYVANISARVPRTHFEDLLLCHLFGDWDAVVPLPAADFEDSVGIARVLDVSKIRGHSLVRTHSAPSKVLGVHMPEPKIAKSETPSVSEDEHLPAGSSILVAGHDLKFAGSLIAKLENLGYKVLVDKWESHTKHDEKQSKLLLDEADAVFCEWGLGNAVWYSRNVMPHQKLVVRVHSQELFRPYLKQIAAKSVDQFIFVGELIRSAAVVSHGVPRDKTTIIPNPVDAEALNRPKSEGAEFGIGFVGMVPMSKRLDRALDVLEALQKVDRRFHLRIKGKTPEDYPWMANRPKEMDFYRSQYERIEAINESYPGSVIFDGYGSDMASWYSKVAYVISTSDFESFHLTLADGAASNATPASIAWPGSDLIYPLDWLAATPEEVASLLIDRQSDKEFDRSFVVDKFDQEKVLGQLVSSITKPTI